MQHDAYLSIKWDGVPKHYELNGKMNHHAWVIKSFYTLREMLEHFESHMSWVILPKQSNNWFVLAINSSHVSKSPKLDEQWNQFGQVGNNCSH